MDELQPGQKGSDQGWHEDAPAAGRTESLSPAERQAWHVLERQLVAEGVTGVDVLVDHEVAVLRRVALRATAVGLIVLAVGLVLTAAKVHAVSMQVTALGALVLSVGVAVIAVCGLLRLVTGGRGRRR